MILPDGHLALKDFGGALPDGHRADRRRLVRAARARARARSTTVASVDAARAVDRARLRRRRRRLRRRHPPPLARALGRRARSRSTPTSARATGRIEGQTYGWDAVLADGAAWFLDDGEGTEGFAGTFARARRVAARRCTSCGSTSRPARSALTEICGLPNGIVANPPAVDVGAAHRGRLRQRQRRARRVRHRRRRQHRRRAGRASSTTRATRSCIPDTGELVTDDHDADADDGPARGARHRDRRGAGPRRHRQPVAVGRVPRPRLRPRPLLRRVPVVSRIHVETRELMARIVVYAIGVPRRRAPLRADRGRARVARPRRVTFVAPAELHPRPRRAGVTPVDADAGEMTPSGLDAYGGWPGCCRRTCGCGLSSRRRPGSTRGSRRCGGGTRTGWPTEPAAADPLRRHDTR